MDARKLVHISDLPNNLHYLPIEIKHLLPVHHAKFLDNATTIISNQASNLHWPLYPDPDLTLSTTHYSQLSGGWCEDIDGQPQHLKSSLELTSIMLNYIHSALALPVPPHNKNTVAQRVEHFKNGSRVVGEWQGLESPSVLAYNLYRMKDREGKTRFLFLLARQYAPEMRLFTLGNTVRQWNLRRLKSEACKEIAAGRCHKLIEHELMIMRGFMPLQEEDHHSKKRDLEVILEKIDEQASNGEVERSQLDGDYVLLFSRFEYNYQGKLQQKHLMGFCAQAVSQLLALLPTNVPVSFVGKSSHLPKLNQLILIWLSTYKPPLADKPVDPTKPAHIDGAITKGIEFLRQKQLETVKDAPHNIADQMIKSSLKVLNKYKPADERERRDLSSNSSSAQLQPNSESGIEDRPKWEFDRMSGISKISFKAPVAKPRDSSTKDLQVSRLVSDNTKGNFESLSSPLMMHRDKDYADLLQKVEQWQITHGTILPWNQLKAHLTRNCENAKVKYGKKTLTPGESNLLLAFGALQYFLDTDELVMLLKHYPDHRESIFEIIFQRSNPNHLLAVGLKIAKDCSSSLYENYLTREFKLDRTNLLVGFLKRYVGLFAGGAVPASLGERIAVPILLDMLETRQYGDEKYRELVRPLLSEIFPDGRQLQVVAPVLHELHLTLVADHHEELVNGLVADLAYECLYYHFDSPSITNAPYRRDTDLRQKKLLEVLREGGFNSLGYELKLVLKPLIFAHSQFIPPCSQIYDEVIVSRPLHITRFIELLTKSQFTQHFLQISKYFKSMEKEAAGITRAVGNVYLKEQAIKFKFDYEEEKVELNGMKSESGIFKQLLAYNPQIKIAGMSLSQVMKNREAETKVNNDSDKWQLEHILANVLCVDLQQAYEFIRVMGSVSQKYRRYQLLKQDEKIYLKEIVHQVLCRKAAIHQYLNLDHLVKLHADSENPPLF